MAVKTEGYWTGEFIVSEAQGKRSREQITVLSGQNLVAGSVVGKVASGAATPAAFAGNAANTGTCGAVTVGAGAKVGTYKVVIIEPASNAGKFTVEDPDGVIVGTGTVAVAFSGGGLGFTIADGATDFIAGEGFDIVVAAGSNKYKLYNAANTDGSEKAVGVLYAAVDASAADAPGVIIARDAEIHTGLLTWFSGATSDEKAAGLVQLAQLGIIGRS